MNWTHLADSILGKHKTATNLVDPVVLVFLVSICSLNSVNFEAWDATQSHVDAISRRARCRQQTKRRSSPHSRTDALRGCFRVPIRRNPVAPRKKRRGPCSLVPQTICPQNGRSLASSNGGPLPASAAGHCSSSSIAMRVSCLRNDKNACPSLHCAEDSS